MTIVVGIAPGGRGEAALRLAAMLARSGGDELVLCAVIPSPWPPSPARIDAEYRAELERQAADAVAGARPPDDLKAETVVHHARSAAAGLLEVAEQRSANAIVVGSSSAGALGRIALGTIGGRLMHSSSVPVALPPRGYRCATVARVTQVTAAYGGAEGADELVVAAAGVAARVGAGLRVASFAVRAHPPYTSGAGTEPDRQMVEQWTGEIRKAADAALTQVRDLPAVPTRLEAVVGYGESWEEALDDVPWSDGEVLVVGSSSLGPVRRVFLGSHATKIVRHAPVPVVVVPRPAAAELAAEAESPEPPPA